MGFLFRLLIVLTICTAVLCCVAVGFLNRLMVVLATCAATAASMMLNRQNKLRRLTSKIPAEADQVLELDSSLYELYCSKGDTHHGTLMFPRVPTSGLQRRTHIESENCRWVVHLASSLVGTGVPSSPYPLCRLQCQ